MATSTRARLLRAFTYGDEYELLARLTGESIQSIKTRTRCGSRNSQKAVNALIKSFRASGRDLDQEIESFDAEHPRRALQAFQNICEIHSDVGRDDDGSGDGWGHGFSSGSRSSVCGSCEVLEEN